MPSGQLGYAIPLSGNYAAGSASALTFPVGAGAVTTPSGTVTYPGGTFTLTANATNYGYLDRYTGILTVSTSGFQQGSIPIFTVVTATDRITSITDNRNDFIVPGNFYATIDSNRVTSDITLPVNTATPIFTFNLPPVARAWAFYGNFLWVISAGTGVNTLSIGVNPSQTPTGATNVMATILTSNANAGTQGSAALSASGATNVLTSGTITPGATVFQASVSGTILAPATAGTFQITMTAAGTTATALAKAGSNCWLF